MYTVSFRKVSLELGMICVLVLLNIIEMSAYNWQLDDSLKIVLNDIKVQADD